MILYYISNINNVDHGKIRNFKTTWGEKFALTTMAALDSLNQPQNPPTTQPMLNTTFSTNQNTNQKMNFAAKKKPVEFTPILVSYVDLLPYLLGNSMVAITPAKVHQPPFFWGYDSNATCAYHEGAPGHSIEHCMISKRKVQSLINAGWLKFEENRSWILTLTSNTTHGTILKAIVRCL